MILAYFIMRPPPNRRIHSDICFSIGKAKDKVKEKQGCIRYHLLWAHFIKTKEQR